MRHAVINAGKVANYCNEALKTESQGCNSFRSANSEFYAIMILKTFEEKVNTKLDVNVRPRLYVYNLEKKKKKEIRDFIVRMTVGFRLHFIPVNVLARIMGVVATSDH